MKRSTKAALGLAIGATALVAATPAMAVAGPYTTDFDSVTIDTAPGAVGTWRMTGPYDAEITDTPDSALRISNKVTSGSFGDHLFSPTLDVAATESGPATTFTASFVLDPVALQPGLRVTVAPDNGQGGRGGFLAIEHTETGIELVSAGSYLDANAEGGVGWTYTTVATGLDANKPHTVKLKLVKKPDTKKSTNNDVFSVQVDGGWVKNTTFEAYYEKTGEDEYNTDTLMFRLSGAAAPDAVGLLIDDVTMATS